ncbi:hypothetical protein Aperf_G00000054161 [Anoplocephala perfoliata]
MGKVQRLGKPAYFSANQLQEFRSENGIPSEGNDVIQTVSTDQISHPVASVTQEINIFNSQLLSSIPSVPTQQQDISSPSQSAKHVLNISESQNAAAVGFLNAANFFRDQQNIDQSGSSFTSEITTAVTEKAAQISQEINHMLGANFDNANQNHSRTPSEAAAVLYAPSGEGNGGNKASRSTSHLSLPNSWQGNVRASPSASSVLIRELQQRNVELAVLLEQRNEQHDRSTAAVTSLRDQLHRLQLSIEEEKRNLEVSTQRELAKARDQVRAHSQAIDALVATKTELEARLAHLERAAETRTQEIQSLTAARNEARAKLQECEDALQLAKSSAAHSETAKTEALRQLEQWRIEAKREKDFRSRLEIEVRNREERLVRLEVDLKRLALSNEDLARQLEVAMAFSKSGSTPKPGTPAATLSDSKIVSKVPCSRCDSLKTRIHELETTEVHTSAEKARLESQYKAYVADLLRLARLVLAMRRRS